MMRAVAIAASILALLPLQPSSNPTKLWVDATGRLLGDTAEWTNRVELADLDGDGDVDLLFANGGNYSDPGKPEPNRVFVNQGPGQRFVERTREVFGPDPDIARVIKVRDLNGDPHPDIIVGTTFQTQSRLYLGEGGGRFREVTSTHLPQMPLSVGDVEAGDVDGDGDLDLVLADWGPGHNMTNAGGRTRLWVNDGAGRFADDTAARMPDALVQFSWDLELVDTDNDFDLDVLVSCKRCGGSRLFRNDGGGRFQEDRRGLPAYTNNYEFEAMDLDGDGFLDLITANDGEIVGGSPSSRREHVFRNDGKGRFRDMTSLWWPDAENVGEDDNMVAFLDFDSDGDADFVLGSLSGPDRLLMNDGTGRLRVALDVFEGPATPGTLAIALADLDGDRRLDVVQGQGEHETAVQERVFLGLGLRPDVAPPAIAAPSVERLADRAVVRARVHDRKSPSMPHDWRSVLVRWTSAGKAVETPMSWYGEYLWRAQIPVQAGASLAIEICATDAAGNRTCVK
jgi:hypothetical protein